jgi:DNA-binding transcriptional ArsR family regulator
MTNALDALSDPTRRAVFERLAAGPASVGEIAAGLPVSRPAVSQHLRVLREAGLVTVEQDGARNIHRLDPRGIGAMRDWLERHWQQALSGLAGLPETGIRSEGEDVS